MPRSAAVVSLLLLLLPALSAAAAGADDEACQAGEACPAGAACGEDGAASFESDGAAMLQALRERAAAGGFGSAAPAAAGIEGASAMDAGVEPIYQLWERTCPKEGREGYGPFSRPLPARAAEAVPSLQDFVAHIAGPPPSPAYYEAVRSRCNVSTIVGARRVQKGRPVEVEFDTPMCFRPEEKLMYIDNHQRNNYVNPVRSMLTHFDYSSATVIMQIGDAMVHDPFLPILKKARMVDMKSEGHVSLMLSDVARHFGPGAAFDVGTPFDKLKGVDQFQWVQQQLKVCKPFKEKADKLVWRGVTTGAAWTEEQEKMYGKAPPQRKRLLTRWADGQSKRIDVAVSMYVQNVTGPWPAKGEVPMERLSENKFLLLADGNDAASGTVWSVFSSSVVLMVWPPTWETLALQGLMKPWVHYIPIKADFSDLDDQMQWCLDNLDDCEDIAHRASLHMFNVWPGSKLSMESLRRSLEIYFDRYRDVIECYCNQD